jgi:hypothetical protein
MELIKRISLILLFIINAYALKPICVDTINTSLSITDSLRNVWPLNEGLCDLKSNNELTITGTGLFNDSGFANNSEGFLAMQDTILTPRAEPFSIIFRCKLDSAYLGSTCDMIIGSESVAGYIAFLSNAQPAKIWLKDSTGTYDDMLTLTDVSVENFNTYALVFKSSDSAKLYVNGVFLTSVGWHGWSYRNIFTKIAGGYTAITKYNLKGTLSYIMYFKKALTPAQVDTLYKNPFQYTSITEKCRAYTSGRKRIGSGVAGLQMTIDSLTSPNGNCTLDIVKNIASINSTISKTIDLNGYSVYIRDSIQFSGYENKCHRITVNDNDSSGLFNFNFSNGKVILSGLSIFDLSTANNSFNIVELRGTAAYTIKNCYITGSKVTGNDTAINFKTTSHDSIFNVVIDSVGTAIKTKSGSKLHASNNFILWCGNGFKFADSAFTYNNATYEVLNSKGYSGLSKVKGYSNACDDSSCSDTNNVDGWLLGVSNYDQENFRDGYGLLTRNNFYYLRPSNCLDRCHYSKAGGVLSDIRQNTYDLVGNPRGWAIDSFSVGAVEYISRPQTATKIRIGAGTGITRLEYGIDSLFKQSSNCTLMIVGALDTLQEARITVNELCGHSLWIIDSIRWGHPVYSNDRLCLQIGSTDGHIYVDGLHLFNVYTKSDVFGILECTYDTITIRNCKIESNAQGKSYGISGITWENHGTPSYVYNNIIHDVGIGLDPVNRNNVGSITENNVVYNCNIGIRGFTYGNMVFKNNVLFNNSISLLNNSNDLVGYNNACDDTTCQDINWTVGSGNVTNIIITDEFTDTNINSAAFGYLETHSRLKGTGIASIAENNKDIGGFNRPYKGVYSIGIREFRQGFTIDSIRPLTGKYQDTIRIYGTFLLLDSLRLQVRSDIISYVSYSNGLIAFKAPPGYNDSAIVKLLNSSDTAVTYFKYGGNTSAFDRLFYNWWSILKFFRN